MVASKGRPANNPTCSHGSFGSRGERGCTGCSSVRVKTTGGAIRVGALPAAFFVVNLESQFCCSYWMPSPRKAGTPSWPHRPRRRPFSGDVARDGETSLCLRRAGWRARRTAALMVAKVRSDRPTTSCRQCREFHNSNSSIVWGRCLTIWLRTACSGHGRGLSLKIPGASPVQTIWTQMALLRQAT